MKMAFCCSNRNETVASVTSIQQVLFVPASILTLGGAFIFGKTAGLGPGVALAAGAVFVSASSGAIAR